MPIIPKVEKPLIDKAIKDEIEAIDVYDRLIDACGDKDEADKKIYKMIKAEEEHHKQLLEKIKKNENG